MNKVELVAKMAEKAELTKKDADAALKGFVEAVEEALEKGDKVQLVGFGTFEARKRAEREAFKDPRNKDLGKKTVPEKTVPVFKAGKEFKDKVAK